MPKQMPKYDPSIRETLDNADWGTVFPKVLKYALSRARLLNWLGDEVDPKMLVNEAVARAYGIGTGGTYRNWNREKCPDLGDFLIGIIRSMTSHLAKHNIKFQMEPLFKNEGSNEEKFFTVKDDAVGCKPLKNPEEIIIENENYQYLSNLLDNLSDENEDLEMVILCIIEGIGKPQLIAEETGYDINRVNNALRKIRRKLKKYNPRLKTNLQKRGAKQHG